MDIEYRSIDPQNFKEVRRFLVTHEYSWRDSDPASFVPKTESQMDKFTEKFIGLLTNGEDRYHCLGAFTSDGVLIASHFLDRYEIDGQKACHVHGLWTEEAFRGKGIGIKLKALGEDWARLKDCVFMDTNVRVSNAPMIALNRKLGYEVARYNFRKSLIN